VCGLEGLFEGADLVAVTLFEFGELGGEGAHDTAPRCFVLGWGGSRRWRWHCVLLLGPKLFDALTYRGAAVEKVQRDTGGVSQPAEGSETC